MTTTTETVSIAAGALMMVAGIGYLVRSNWQQKTSSSYGSQYQQMQYYGGGRRHTRKRRT